MYQKSRSPANPTFSQQLQNQNSVDGKPRLGTGLCKKTALECTTQL